MGKVRAKTLGDQEQEQKEREEAEKRRLAKIEAAKARLSTTEVVDDGGQAEGKARKEAESLGEKPEEKKSEKKDKFKKTKARKRSENYTKARALIENSKLYTIAQALELVEKTHLAKFDESVELHINTNSVGISGNVVLPHGTGKQTRVAIIAPASNAAAADALLKQIETGKIDFDILVATPDAMPRLAKVAKILGPKGLMPNPKNGTISANPELVAEKFKAGQMNFKTEAKAPVIHMMVGKLSFGKEKLEANIKTALGAVKNPNIKNVTLKSTMSPAIRLSFGK